ncbi:hypothetical protein [Lachnoclostridium sp.]|uniref:hypothetical protein n=1 Tax=Lachnoclostridium sp. TaxID=2028282 RepID=UPI00289B3090|nr:hypothetical protein [Lachnoclostridium sp.]
MNELIKPKALKPGDTIALISISGGRGGDADMIPVGAMAEIDCDKVLFNIIESVVS